jgi:hypothetical protein
MELTFNALNCAFWLIRKNSGQTPLSPLQFFLAAVKIISWNLKNIGATKLANVMNATIAAAGYGNNVLDFMVNLVMGNAIWVGVNLTLVPVDIFLVVELKSGGHNKNTPAFGTAIPTLTAIRNAMNVVAAALPAGGYHYSFAPPIICGYHECVGVIYNDLVLAYNNGQILRDNMLHYVNPRSPYIANFTVIATGAAINVVGIHAPPPGGAAAVRFQKPISFCVRLPSIPMLMGGPAPPTFVIGGDFNCDPGDSWTVGGVARFPFNNPSPPAPPNMTLNNFATNLPGGTLTSARKKVDNSQVGNARYLSGAYDNLLYKSAVAPANEYAMDLIGTVNAWPLGLVAKLNNFWVVSDHLPVAIV